VDDVEINYAKVGKGDHPVLLLPGGLGKTNCNNCFLYIKEQLYTKIDISFTL